MKHSRLNLLFYPNLILGKPSLNRFFAKFLGKNEWMNLTSIGAIFFDIVPFSYFEWRFTKLISVG